MKFFCILISFFYFANAGCEDSFQADIIANLINKKYDLADKQLATILKKINEATKETKSDEDIINRMNRDILILDAKELAYIKNINFHSINYEDMILHKED